MDHGPLSALAYNGKLVVNSRDVFVRNTGLNIKKTYRGNLAIAGSTLTFTKVDKDIDGGTGVWIPYTAQTNVWGFLKPGHTWAASGPYSGCVFEIGEVGGRIYAAHLSREGHNDPNIAAWDNVEELRGKRVIFSQVIGVYSVNPSFTTIKGTAGVTIAKINQLNQTVTSVTRLNIITAGVDGSSGRIMGVSRLA